MESGSTTLRRVLFVDDEPALLGLLQALFQRMAGPWDLAFAPGGSQALELMGNRPFDVVISDMRMPEMNGVELLTEVRRRHPGTARMILSGYADQHLVMRSLGVAHQFMAKPFDIGMLESAVRRLVSLGALLGSDQLRVLEARIQALPSLPTLYADLMEELASPDATTESVGDLISQDVSLTAKLLQLVNSAFFGVAQQVTSARQAVQILGFGLVRTLALSIYVFSRFDPAKMPAFPMERLWRHSLDTGLMARRIATGERATPDQVETAFTAGILHDIGKLALGFSLPQLHRAAVDQAVAKRVPTQVAEKEVVGAGHPEVGAFLLGLWGLPAEIVDVVAWHHEPGAGGGEGFSPLTAVHMAEYLLSRQCPIWDPAPPARFDEGYLRDLRLEAKLLDLGSKAGRDN